jgi:enoyl-[acyl-carrier protein] reductase II
MSDKELEAVSRRRMLALLGASGAAMAFGASDAAAETAPPPPRPSLDTRLTRDYGVRFPFVGAGMGFVSMPSLVAAVSNAGGIGVLGNAIEPPPSTQALIRMVRSLTTKLFGVNFIVDDSAFGPIATDAHIDVCVEERVPLVVFHMNVPPRAWVERLHKAGARVWMQCASVEQAAEAAQLGVDAVIAQGSQAGGHNKSRTRTFTLLPRIIDAVHPLLVLAAGGIGDGDAVAEAITRGADGVWVGTRLVASAEAHAHAEYKRRLTVAKGDATATTTMFGPEYPNRPYRVLRNRIVNQFAGRENEIPNPPPPPAVIGTTFLFPLTIRQPYQMPKFSAIVPTPETLGDFEEMGMPAGSESLKAIDRVQPAAQIIATMMADARAALREQHDERGDA